MIWVGGGRAGGRDIASVVRRGVVDLVNKV